MVQLVEWAKGITFGLFGVLLFYFYWDNIFLGMINFIGNFSIAGVTDTGSIAILKTIAWISFVVLFIVSVPAFTFYSILVGSKNSQKTHPLEILKGIGIWLVSAPIGLIIYIIVASVIAPLATTMAGVSGGMSAGDIILAGQFSWLIALVAIGGVNIFPYYYILKGYGQLGGTNEE